MWRELEEQRKKEELDPAKQAGAAILELEGADAGVQRLRALGAQVRAKLGLPSASGDAAQEGPLEQAGEAGGSMSGDSAADTASLTSGGTHYTASGNTFHFSRHVALTVYIGVSALHYRTWKIAEPWTLAPREYPRS